MYIYIYIYISFPKHLDHLKNNFEIILYYIYSRYFELHSIILAFSSMTS